MLSEGQECTEDRLDLLKRQKIGVFFTRSFSSVRLSTWHSQNLHKCSFIPANAVFALQRERSLRASVKMQLKADWGLRLFSVYFR